MDDFDAIAIEQGAALIEQANLMALYERSVAQGEEPYQANLKAAKEFKRERTEKGRKFARKMLDGMDLWIAFFEQLLSEADDLAGRVQRIRDAEDKRRHA